MTLEIHQFACLKDNYGYLVRDTSSGIVAAIDAPDAEKILIELTEHGWDLSFILNTHWHADHVSGNLALKALTGASVIGPDAERDRIPGIDQCVGHGDSIRLGETLIDVIGTPGHTLGHLSYHMPDRDIVFVGDALFVMGCGRIFEGTAGMMCESLARLARLPEETIVYCAHEYGASNVPFALSVSDDPMTAARAELILAARSRGEPTVPTSIGLERATNPFLRVLEPLRDGSENDEISVAAFARLRSAKDTFRG